MGRKRAPESLETGEKSSNEVNRLKKKHRKSEDIEGFDGVDKKKKSGIDNTVEKKKKNKKNEQEGKDSDEKGEKGNRDEQANGFAIKKKKSKNAAEANGKDKMENGKMDRDLQVIVSGGDSSNPKFKALEAFSASGLPENVIKCCVGFERPSPIQAHAWPFLLEGRDLIGIAATGSGKTLAFGVPALMHALKKRRKRNTRQALCLVLCPTRELAQQTAEVLEDAGASCDVKVICIYGGVSKETQKSALRSGVEIIVATPGRLQDLVDEGVCNLQHVTYLVLDEADRMLDLGFEPAVRAIVNHVPKERQTIMFSATWPVAVEALAQEFIQEPSPVKITVGSQDLAANHDVTQIVEVLDDKTRDARLEALLRLYHKTKRNRVLVFVLYKKEAGRVERALQQRGWKVRAIHGDKSQEARNQALSAFKDGSHPLLVATDCAARGLDIPDVEYVINYSFPLTTEDYVHRIGRTGRAGKKGIAHTFFTTADKARAGELVNILREAGQTIPEELLKFGTHVKKKESKLYGAHFREIAADAPKAQKITFDSDND